MSPGRAIPNQGVHVGTVPCTPPALLVDDAAHRGDIALEDPQRVRVCQHQRGHVQPHASVKGFHMQLPLPTRIILAISNFSVAYWPYLLVAGILAFFLIRRYLQTEKGRFKWDRAKLRLPIVGSILLRATLSRFARSFSMSFSAGVPLLQALGITARAVDNSYIESKLQQMGNGIERGDTLTNTAAGTEIFTPLVLQMLAVGEETGAIDTMLNDVAEFYEREVDYDLKNLTSAIEPILIVAIGGMVLVLALGVFLPMWNLTQIAHAH